MAQIFGSDLASVSVGDHGRSGDRHRSRRSFRNGGQHLGAGGSRTPARSRVRVVVDNPGDLLKKQMYVRVLIQARQESTGLLVPVSAILRDDENLPFVYVVQPDGSFARQHVTLGYRDRRSIRHRRRSQGRRPDRGRWRHLRSIHAKSMSDDLPHRESAPRTASIMNRIVASSLRQRLLVILMTLVLIGAGSRSLQPPAGGCLSRSVAADRRDHHPMARTRRRGSGAADHGAGRNRR